MYLLALCFGLMLSLGIIVFYVKQPTFSLYHPLTIYSAFHFLLFVIRPFFAYFLDFHSLYIAYQYTPSLEDKITVIAAANLGYAAFAFFSLRAGNAPVRFRSDRYSDEEKRRLAQTFVWVIAICGPIALFSLLNNFSASGNYDGLILDKGTGIVINTKKNGYLTDAQLMLAPICAILAWLGRFRLLSLVPMALFVLARGSTGGRGPFVAALVMLLLLYLYDKRLKLPAMRLLAAGIAVTMFFSFVGYDRGASLRQAIGFEAQESVFVAGERDQQFMETMDIANMEFFEYVVWVVPQRSGSYDYFLNNLQIFTEPVPRVLWPGKPIGAPFQPVRFWEHGTPIGMTMSLPGVGWYSLGWAGVIIWCGLWGFVLGRIYARFWSGEQSTITVAAYMIMTASLVVSFRDGLLLTIVRLTGVYMTPIVIWVLAARYFAVPSVGAMRAWARLQARRSRKTGKALPNGPETGEPERASVAMRALPPAVRRRRLALLEDKRSTAEG